MKRETDKLLNRWIKALPWICLVGLFVYLSVFMQLHGDCLTDSDISSEMLLAEILNGEHALVSKNWYYSTELRVLNIQLLYSFFFHLFGDWTMVRTGACVVSYLLMLLSYYYMMHQMGQDRFYAVSAIFLLLPVSDGYFEYVLLALLYASFISISFFDGTGVPLWASVGADEEDRAGACGRPCVYGGAWRRKTCCGAVCAAFCRDRSDGADPEEIIRISGLLGSGVCRLLCGLSGQFPGAGRTLSLSDMG